ncbi:hypothetical protein ABZV31_26415 [Streptomyces sp. NPDC005202]|uniref:hypothetical protein n=1 Tax=Streptomyces sp. NPDC005202 TaxID=3157021 RepID=UPI0033BDAFBC
MNEQARSGALLTGPTGHTGQALLGIYLNDHLAGATAGTDRARHLATACRGSQIGAAMAPVAAEIAEDRKALMGIMRRLDIPIRRYKVYAGRLGERAGRLKSNGRLVRRSPLSSLLELELLQIGVHGKTCAWQVLRRLSERDERLDAQLLDGLLERARGQLHTIDEIRHRQAEETFHLA